MCEIKPISEAAANYLSSIDSVISEKLPKEIARRIERVTWSHENWRNRKAISLNAAENVMSRRARRLLDSDLCTRVSEGVPGDKDFPAHLQNRFIDEIEATIVSLLRRMFRAQFVEWRPVSTSMANATVFFAITKANDMILSQPAHAGGNYSYNENGPPRAANLRVKPLPFNEESFEVDVDRAVAAIEMEHPSLVVIGGSNVLFPYPLEPLRCAADNVGATVLYDAAHIGLLICGGLFQDPLNEGADVLTLSGHKIMSGPVGGFILTNRQDLAEKIIDYSFPTLMQTRDQNKYAAAAYALAEMAEFGRAYAWQAVRNAQALGYALQDVGFKVLCAERSFTQTHQVFMLLGESDETEFEQRCQKANLLVTKAQRMGRAQTPAGRLSTQEVTRRGMKERDMVKIAEWLARVIKRREDPRGIAREIEGYLKGFRDFEYSF